MTYEQREHMASWIKALRSGNYRRINGRLFGGAVIGERTNKVGYCCLGVACSVYKKETGDGKWKKNNINKDRTFVLPNGDTDDAALTGVRAVADYFGLDEKEESNLITMNDTQDATFREIADYLEATYL